MGDYKLNRNNLEWTKVYKITFAIVLTQFILQTIIFLINTDSLFLMDVTGFSTRNIIRFVFKDIWLYIFAIIPIICISLSKISVVKGNIRSYLSKLTWILGIICFLVPAFILLVNYYFSSGSYK